MRKLVCPIDGSEIHEHVERLEDADAAFREFYRPQEGGGFAMHPQVFGALAEAHAEAVAKWEADKKAHDEKIAALDAEVARKKKFIADYKLNRALSDALMTAGVAPKFCKLSLR